MPDVFSPQDIARIIALGESKSKETGRVANTPESNIRRSEIGWISCDPESQWLYDVIVASANVVNEKTFGFDLWNIEPLQYAVYQGSTSTPGHYAWHVDMSLRTLAPRKLSIVIPLSDSNEYEGGDFEFMYGGAAPARTIDREPGAIHFIPSWCVHQVTAVTKGLRRSLVGWCVGPQFR